jgi:anti-sigma regulatory factor (Ser/Thr protein kinase)/predicted N-acetyltransferase YhbS
MEPFTISIANELSALSVLQAATTAFIRAVGGEDRLADQIELVLEEIFTNILKYGYLPGQRERIELTLGIDGELLGITMRFKGIPLDIDYLRQCEQANVEDMFNDGCHGIGLHLIRQLCDKICYSNLGKEGQEIALLRRISTKRGFSAELVCAEDVSKQISTPFDISVRRMRPDEAATVSKLAYFAYNYSYIYGHIYDPEQVRSLNEEDRLISYVAVHETKGIVGHSAISPDDRSDMLEMCAAFVDPRFRGSGCLNKLAEHALDEARKMGAEGVFATAVTAHPYSQKAASGRGLRETALFVSRLQPLAMRAIRDREVARESLFFMTKLFGEESRGPYYSPKQHRQMLERICRHLEVEAVFDDCHEEIVLPEFGQLEQKADNYQAGHIFIHSYGSDTVHLVRTSLRRWQLDRLETIYLYQPLLQPSTAGLCASFEAMGFFFSGLRHGRRGDDWLVLQYLNNQRYDYSLLNAATSFGQELMEYVRERDPVCNL